MREPVRTLLAEAAATLRREWRALAMTDIAFKAIAFAILTPAVTGLIYLFRAGTLDQVVADVDIARFFFTTPAGIVTLLLGTSLIVAITAVEAACLMAIDFGRAQGVTLNARSALRFGATHAWQVLRLTGTMVRRRAHRARARSCSAAGLVYWPLLREHDINYYLAQRPPEFVIAVGIVARHRHRARASCWCATVARWALALPLVLFEQVHPRQALGESAKRVSGSTRRRSLAILASWAAGAIALAIVVTCRSWSLIGRTVAPRLAGSLPLLLLFVGTLCSVRCGARTGGGGRQFLAVRAVAHRGSICGSASRGSPCSTIANYASDGPATPLRARSRGIAGRGRPRGARASLCARSWPQPRPGRCGDHRASRLLGGRAREHPGGFPAGRASSAPTSWSSTCRSRRTARSSWCTTAT